MERLSKDLIPGTAGPCVAKFTGTLISGLSIGRTEQLLTVIWMYYDAVLHSTYTLSPFLYIPRCPGFFPFARVGGVCTDLMRR